MSSRPVASNCLFAILLSTLALGQSTRTAVAGQQDGPSPAQRLRQGTIPNLPQMPQVAPLAHHVARAPRRIALPMVGSQFASAVTYDSAGSGASSVAVADVNGDGKPDLVVSNQCASSSDCNNGTVGVLLGNGDGTFQTAVAYGSGGYRANSVAVADVNGDGKPDLVVSNQCASSSNCNNGTVGVLLGNGDGTFQTAVAWGSGGQTAVSVAVADLNGDGRPDLLVANSCASCSGNAAGTVALLLGNGDGTFQTAVTFGIGSGVVGPTSVVVADVNGDGKPDLLVASKCGESPVCTPDGYIGAVSVLLGNGDGTFQAAVGYLSGDQDATSLAVGDVNRDGKPDLVVSNYCVYTGEDCFPGADSVGVLLGNGNGTFRNAVTYDAGGFGGTSVALGDVNGDGKPDLLVASMCASADFGCQSGTASVVGVLFGNGDGTFQPVVTYSPGGYSASSIAVADVNGDGSPDLVVANACGSTATCTIDGTVGVLLNTATGTASSTTLSPISPSTVPFGSSITLTANVDSAAGPPPDGEILSFENAAANVTLGTGPLSKGTASFTSTAIPAGSYSVVASYPGGSGFWSSISSPPQVLKVQDFTLAASPATVTISAPGQSGSTTITVTTYGNLNAQTVTNWGCSGLPSECSCSFGSVNTKNQISLNINTMAAADLHWPLFRHHSPLFYALFPFVFGMVSVAGRRRTCHGTRVLAWILLLCLTVLWLACGGGGSGGNGGHGGTPTGSNTVTVTATSGSLKRSTTIALNVQ